MKNLSLHFAKRKLNENGEKWHQIAGERSPWEFGEWGCRMINEPVQKGDNCRLPRVGGGGGVGGAGGSEKPNPSSQETFITCRGGFSTPTCKVPTRIKIIKIYKKMFFNYKLVVNTTVFKYIIKNVF
jgi:hypothetical protein